jgi:A/G-specific adenine glycosylase
VIAEFTNLLLNWYAENARDLPWRGRVDPYAVWVSEVMLQQTRVDTVIPYFERWMSSFPTVTELAQASQRRVLSAWEGLGYYSRARNLHRAAQIVVDRYGGELPEDLNALMNLPGIGRYTAGAIASIAFDLDEPALDGNIRRVLARVFDLSIPARSREGENRLWELATEHLPAGSAGAYNQALMDLGATICKPRAPDCGHCPLARLCQARILGIQEERPVTMAKAAIPHHSAAAAVIRRNKKLLIAQRQADGLLGGMWEFPAGKLKPGEDLVSGLKRKIAEELNVTIQVGEELGVFHHAYTHFRITLHAYRCTIQNGKEPVNLEHQELKWVSVEELAEYPMGKIDRQIALNLVADC